MYEWNELESMCHNCTKCELSKTRRNVVIGRGSKKSKIMIIGEGPGEQEDIQGIPFVGRAGQLLDTLLTSLYFTEDDYYIGNIVKCRPPGNRNPTELEANTCIPYLRNQVYLIKPKIIICLGGTAVKYIVDPNAKITKTRGNWIERKGYFIMPTFHPAAVLRDASKKMYLWRDFKKIKEKFDLLEFSNN
jgi:DNA polymerase